MERVRFEIYTDKAGGYRWRLVAANDKIVADSAEAYTRDEDAERAVRAVIRLAGIAAIVRPRA